MRSHEPSGLAATLARRLAVPSTALTVLTIGVTLGWFTRLDQWVVDHFSGSVSDRQEASPMLTGGIFLPFNGTTPNWAKPLATWTWGGSIIVSILVIGWVAYSLRNAGRPLEAKLWLAVWFVGDAIEVAGKHELTRPVLYGTVDGVRSIIGPFTSSYPSGHTLRAFFVAAAITAIRPAWRRGAFAWFALVPVFLIVIGAHSLTDVIGGTLLAMVCCRTVVVVANGR
ncbi:MAG: phosphatase PAP2 family protein [Actinobacteria bacterium]|uniref:Unannotated protein n=1 Tax=freshwater metagenome TaxID=449393 RepID=A0A6J6PM54_9ZZZZ|nr:phosphatase PAP2 family protein [Actinomycetota bacterium]